MEKNPVCIVSQDTGNCVLIVPKQNILSPDINNELVYINRIADQIIRYKHIRKYILDPSHFMSLEDVSHVLSKNETVIPHSILKSTYFDNLIPHTLATQTNTQSYDQVNPYSTKDIPVTNNKVRYTDTSHIPAIKKTYEQTPDYRKNVIKKLGGKMTIQFDDSDTN